MKSKYKKLIKETAYQSAVSSVLVELCTRHEHGDRKASAKARNKTFLERHINQLYNSNSRTLTLAFNKCPGQDKLSMRQSCAITLEAAKGLNKRAAGRLGLSEELIASIVGV